MPTLTQVLADVLEIKGVLAAAVASVDGEVLAGAASDTALLERISGAVTGALAAGEALSGLVAESLLSQVGADAGGDEDGTHDTGQETGAEEAGSAATPDGDGRSNAKQLMVIYEDSGPIVFTPLPGGERVAVLALGSAHDLGRARFQLRGLTHALATAEVPLP